MQILFTQYIDCLMEVIENGFLLLHEWEHDGTDAC